MAPMTAAEYSKLKVTELKELLTSRALPTNGVKSELVSRLVAADANPTPAPAAEEKKDSLNPDDYDINWDDEDHAGSSAPTNPASTNTTTSASKPAAPTTKPAASASGGTPSTSTTSASGTAPESNTEGGQKKFQFKSIAAQFEEEEKKKAAAAEAAKNAAEEKKEDEAKTTDEAPAQEAKPTGPVSSKIEALPASHPTPLTLEEELEKRKARAARFGLSVEDNEAIKKLERAKKFGGGDKAAEVAEGEGEKKVVVVKGLDQALGHDKKRRSEGNGRGDDKRRRGGSFGGGHRGGNRGRGGFRGGRGGNQGGDRRSGAPSSAPLKKITDDPVEKAKAEARAKRFAQGS